MGQEVIRAITVGAFLLLLSLVLIAVPCTPSQISFANDFETTTIDAANGANTTKAVDTDTNLNVGVDNAVESSFLDNSTSENTSTSDNTNTDKNTSSNDETDENTSNNDSTYEAEPTIDATSIQSLKPAYNSITITWKKAANAQKYVIYRSTKKSSGYKAIKTITNPKTLSYKDSGLTLGKTYYYKVRAYYKSTYQQSTVKSARVQPAQITTCTVKSQNYQTVKVSWNKVAGAQGYYVYRSTSLKGTYKKVGTIKKGSTTSYKNTKLTSGETYYYKVSAYRSAKGKKYCGSKSVAVAGKAQPNKVTVTKASHSSGKVALSWKTVSGASGYEIYRSTSKSSGYTKVKTATKSTKSWKNSGLGRGKTYYYKIRAYRTVKGKKVYGSFSSVKSVAVPLNRWDKLLNTYRTNSSVNQLIFVKYSSGSKATVYVYNKQGSSWKNVLKCQGYVGQNGINKVKEGDRKTPTGTFGILGAFGIKAKPTTSLPYTKVNKYLYWCGDKKYYNQLIDVREHPHTCHGEHLIDYKGVYDYGLFLDYNPSKTYKKGSAIFMHCSGSYGYTGGCVAVSQSNMLKVLKVLEPGAKICIYPA